MYLDRIHRRLNELAELGVDLPEPTPSDPSEIAALERKLGIRLPGAVRELYLWGGEDPGIFNETGVLPVSLQIKKDFRAEARKILSEANESPSIIDAQTLILEEDYDSNFSFVRTDQGDDPPVYTHLEQNPGRTFCSCSRYSDYLALVVEQCAGIEPIELIESLEELKELSETRAHEPQHILFSGEIRFATIPDEVFAFEELRGLNLVCKGLIELSPRIGEFAFLKHFYFAQNSVSILPMALANLADLEELDLGNNQLTSVIAIIRELPNLRYCTVNGNPISPDELDQLKSEFPNVEIKF
jgi:hypothetical protein